MDKKPTNPGARGRWKKLTADDYLELAEQAGSKKERMELIDQALVLEPENPEAQLMLAQEKLDFPAVLRVLDREIDQEDKRLRKEEGITDADIGSYWGIWETRDYMRMRFDRMDALTMMGRFRQAAKEGEELMRLCEDDNLGVRYHLLGRYLELEDFDQLKALLSSMKEKGEDSLEMAFARSVMHWTLGEEDQALEALKEIKVTGLRPFLKAYIDEEEEKKYFEEREEMDQIGGYRPNSVQHLLELTDIWPFLRGKYFVFLHWAYENLKRPVRRRA